ncbi:GGDEF domain-containing protein [Actinoplanes friuliensis]|uniref:Putative signaling protein n=1 Tax=Actinoplanes friuliensis DSM 7358 TaxID=1246995 RepID=U5VY97_9ACTN|nr:GGDEF domain-containing protein [Actinoplanes friuliensis]AGZ41752.1 putative signaling protein [Actinoplanes friuliensis DSM 7358]
MRTHLWKLYALAALLAIVAYQLIPETPAWKVPWQVGLGWAAAAAIAASARRMNRHDRLPWFLFAAGIFANATGIAVAEFCTLVLDQTSMPTLADPFFLGLYPACAYGLVLMIRRRESRRNTAAVIDSAIVTVGFGLLAWIFVIQPTAFGLGMTAAAKAVQVGYPIGDLVLLALTARLLRGGGVRGSAFWWVTASLTAFLVGDTCWVVLGNLDEQVQDMLLVNRGVESVALVAYSLFAVAALHPSSSGLSRSTGDQSRGVSPALLLLLTAASLVAPVTLIAQAYDGSVTNGTAIGIGSTVLFLLVVGRMSQLLRQVERQSRLVRELARTDELTGLANRRAWNDELPRALEVARRDGVPVSVALLDLDNFKTFNDTYGHPAGDRLLKEASAAWHGQLRTTDTLARWGGEEFIVLLPAAGPELATEALHRALTATPAGQTFSAGVAAWDGTETSDELIARADSALYRAKHAGRNRVLTAEPALTR